MHLRTRRALAANGRSFQSVEWHSDTRTFDFASKEGLGELLISIDQNVSAITMLRRFAAGEPFKDGLTKHRPAWFRGKKGHATQKWELHTP